MGDGFVHVPAVGGQPWTVGTALATLSAVGGLGLNVSLLGTEAAGMELSAAISLRQPLGAALEALLVAGGLCVRRRLWREAGRVLESRTVVPVECGRRVQLAGPDAQRPGTRVQSLDARQAVDAAQEWIAQARGWLVESTFDLLPGWDRALEGRGDATYSRLDNPDFAMVEGVYRLWVLNEDGRFTGPPFGNAAGFDLAAFFGEPELRPQPLALEACLTLDSGGLPRPAMVEMSIDGGATWQAYPGQAGILAERAGVRLTDAVLPSGFLAAAQGGLARMRVTASLRSPLPVQVRRWRGDAFRGTQPARVLDTGRSLAFGRVAAGSVHAAAVRRGEWVADERDDRPALVAWLNLQLRRRARAGAPGDGRLRLELARADAAIDVGDRLEAPVGAPGRRTIAATVTAVSVRWLSPQAPGRRSSGPAPHTVLELGF